MDENGLLCDVDAAALAEWCCICTFPLKPLCTDHKDTHLKESQTPGLFHYLLPSSAARGVRTMEDYHSAMEWLFALSSRQTYLETSIQKLSGYREVMNAAFEELQASLNDRRTQMNQEFDTLVMGVKQEVLTAIEETSRHTFDSFTPAPGLQTLLWSNESTAADFPVFDCSIETFADDAFMIVLDSTFPQFLHLSLKHESNAHKLKEELARAKVQLEIYVTTIHDLETKCSEEIAKRKDIEKAVIATQREADAWRTKYLALEKAKTAEIDDLRKQLNHANNDAKTQKTAAFQWEEKYKKEAAQWKKQVSRGHGQPTHPNSTPKRNVNPELQGQRSQAEAFPSPNTENARPISKHVAQKPMTSSEHEKEPEPKKEMKPGQWECTHCTLINEAKDRICGACAKTSKDLLHPSPPSEEDVKVEVPTFGFWICENCHYIANSQGGDLKCYKCKADKYPSNVGKSTVHTSKTSGVIKKTPKPTERGETEDWICQKCNEKNFSWKSKCRMCDEPKEPVPEAVETGQWICANCGTENSQIRSYCKGCFERKPGPSDVNPYSREQPKSVPRFDVEPADISASHKQAWYCSHCNRKNTGPQTHCEFCFRSSALPKKPDQKEVPGKCETCGRAFIGLSPLCVFCPVIRSSTPDFIWKREKC